MNLRKLTAYKNCCAYITCDKAYSHTLPDFCPFVHHNLRDSFGLRIGAVMPSEDM